MSTFSLSPSVEIREIDQTTIVPGVSTSVGAFAGAFSWGPVHEMITINDETQLIKRFAKPTDQNYEYFFSASSFLSYSNNLKVVRCEQTGMANANSSGSDDLLIRNRDQYNSLDGTYGGSPEATGFSAKYPGVIGNSISVSYCLACDAQRYTQWEYAEFFNTEPGTSQYAADRGSQYDEIHVIVIDTNGKVSGIPGTVLETFEYLSIASDAKAENGRSLYIRDVLAEQSEYIYFLNNDANLDGANAGDSVDVTPVFFNREEGSPVVDPDMTYALTKGEDGALPTVAERNLAYDMFKNPETVDVNLIIAGPSPTTTLDDIDSYCNYLIQSISASRHDSVTFVSPPTSGTYSAVGQTDVNNVVSFLDELNSSSFGVADTNPIRIYDKYNDKYRWIPANGSIAGLCARTDDVADAWWSPAGLNRGGLNDVVKVAYNPTKADRDLLYKKRGNPIVEYIGQGTFLFGDKTLLSRPSAFDRINVRRLFNVLEKSIATAARFHLFEFNDEFSRSQFVNMVEPYLRNVKGRRGIYDFKVVCDESNNPSDVIDREEFIGDIYISPARSINFLRLNFIATRTGVDFSEIVS